MSMPPSSKADQRAELRPFGTNERTTTPPPTLPQAFGRRTVVVFRKDLLPGSETFIREQLRAYRRWRPVLVGYRRCPGLELTGIETVVLQRKRRALLDRLALKLMQHAQYWGAYSRRFCGLVNSLEPRIIHAHYGYDAVLVCDIARVLRLPLVVTFHGMDVTFDREIWRSGVEGYFFRRYPDKLQQMFRDPNVHFITVSKALRDTALRRGAPSERTHVFYTGVDCRSFSPGGRAVKQRRNVLFVGRLVPIKGCVHLIAAMQKVQRFCPQATLVILGDGPLRNELQAAARDRGVKVRFTGALASAGVRQELAEARTLCLPSITDSNRSFETFGMVIAEAQASGVPVLTSARGGIEGIVPGTTGYAFAEGDRADLASQIMQLQANDDLCERMSRAAVGHARQHFDIDRCTALLELFYDGLLADNVRDAASRRESSTWAKRSNTDRAAGRPTTSRAAP
jgi:glycosyltransferase involved in cell wall biosynthesis